MPHIVRWPDINDLNLRGVAAGTDTVVKLNMAPRPAPESPAATAPKPEPTRPVTPIGAVPLPGLPGGPVAPGIPPATPAPAPEGAKPAANLTLRFDPPAAKIQLGAQPQMNLQVDNANDLSGAPMRIKWDPKVLRLLDVSRGPMFAGDGQQPIFTRNIRNDEGEAAVILNRVAGQPGVNGSGTLLTLTFQAVGKGSTVVTAQDVALRDSKMQPVNAGAPAAMVNVE